MPINQSLRISLFTLLAASTMSAATFKLQKPVYSTWENAGPLTITVLRSGVGTNNAASVELFTTNLTAQAGVDYDETVTTVNFDPGQLSATTTIGIIDDNVIEPLQKFQVKLRNPGTGNTIVAPGLATVSILDDDSIIQFSSKTFTTQEALKFATITIKRFGNLATTGQVNFATSDGSATAGSDYLPTNGTVIFPPHVAIKTIQVRPINDTIDEGNETVGLALSNPIGAILGTNDTATLTILDNDTAGVIKLSAGTINVDSIKTNVAITILRTGGVASGVTVHFVTADGTALSGTNYIATTGTVSFPAGVASATINVPIIPASGTGANKTFTFTLNSPTGGATLGTVAQSTVTIAFKPDPNAVPVTGPVFMSGTANGQPFNPPANAVVGSIFGLNSGFQVVGVSYGVSGYTATVKQLIIDVAPFTTGTMQLDNTGSHGLMTYVQTVGVAGRTWSVADGSASVGSYGTVIVDGIDTINKMISGRFDFHARETSDAIQPNGGFIRINGKFRCHYP